MAFTSPDSSRMLRHISAVRRLSEREKLVVHISLALNFLFYRQSHVVFNRSNKKEMKTFVFTKCYICSFLLVINPCFICYSKSMTFISVASKIYFSSSFWIFVIFYSKSSLSLFLLLILVRQVSYSSSLKNRTW